MPQHLVDVVVSAIRQLTPRIRELVLKAADGKPLPAFDAGAHLELHFRLSRGDGDGPVIRRYSLVGGLGLQDDGRSAYRIAVQREDHARGSAFIHDHFTVGTQLKVAHPKNNFPLDRRDSKSLLIAGGIGITPIISMVRSLVQRNRDFEVVYTGRRPQDMAYVQDLQDLAGDRVRLHPTEQAGEKKGDQADGARVDLQALLAAQVAGTGVYVCGPGSLIQDTHLAAVALGWDAARVRSERFTPGPTGDEVGFELTLTQSARTLYVGPHTSILEAMTAAGLHPLFDCGRGECGLCPLPVVQAQGPLQHRDIFLSDAEKAAGKTLCICVSRVCGPRLVLAA